MDLLDSVIARQQGSPGIELIDQTPKTPHIRLGAIELAAEQHLRRPVPPCGYEFSEFRLLVVIPPQGP